MPNERSTYQVIITKRDTRNYADRPVPDDVLHQILQAGRMAGSAKDDQLVRLIVVKERDQRLALARCGQWMDPLNSAALGIVIVLGPEEGQPSGQYALHRGAFDAGRTGQNIMIAAWAEGITSCPVSVQDHNQVRALLGIPEDHKVANVIALAYPSDSARHANPNPRLPLDTYVHWERWQPR